VLAFLCAPAIARWRPQAKHLALAASILLVFAYRYAVWQSFIGMPDASRDITHWMMQGPAMFDSFALGMWVACTGYEAGESRRRAASLILGLIFLVALGVVFSRYADVFWTTPALAIFFRTAVALMALCLLLSVMNTDGYTGTLRQTVFVHLGKISYGIYLWHLIVLHMVQSFFASPGVMAMLIVATLTLVLATLTYYAVERPLMRRARVRVENANAPIASPAALRRDVVS
jgi:peptidoglycan/LPS O-acetylase OafA/YrhL